MELNRLLDALPRTRLGTLSREVPAFRTCGVAGFYLAAAAALGGALLAGRELLPAAMLCAVSALAFFAYVYVRRWVTGREKLVLLEQVWTAEVFCAVALWALGLPVLPYMDVAAPAIAFFLAGGRVGCLLVGCCHGRPSSLGIVYPHEHAAEGFPRHLAGVRLFPVQALESAGLAFIGVAGMTALPFAAPGRVFAWFLAAYAVLRFGTEALRGDRRPHWLGMSVPRWMSLGELAAACWITRSGRNLRDAAILAFLLGLLAVALAVRRRFDRTAALLSAAHADELRAAVDDAVRESRADSGAPVVRHTREGVAAAASPAADGGWMHVSLALPGAPAHLEALCGVAARAFPELDPAEARVGAGGVLHFAVLDPPDPSNLSAVTADELYGAVVRRLQAPVPASPEESMTEPVPSRGAYFARPVPVDPRARSARATNGTGGR